jgi:hypothetical protein
VLLAGLLVTQWYQKMMQKPNARGERRLTQEDMGTGEKRTL